jgi:tRNA 2-thiouridine synthesizing protein B
MQPGDALLLTESAVLALPASSDGESQIPVYALEADALARGVSGYAGEAILVDFPAMVEMTAIAQNVISW